jgi:hypothetical protein
MTQQTAPLVPSSNAPLTKEDGSMSVHWFRPIAQAIKAQPPIGALVPYQGSAPPQGWTLNTTPGLPTLPAGYIWVQK